MGKPTVTNHQRGVATKGSGHQAVATSPDMCFVPGTPPPQPFPNVAPTERLAAGQTVQTFIADQPIWTSAGEVGPLSDPAHAGSGGGVVSGTYRAEAKPTSYSCDLFFEGGGAVCTGDTTTQNHGNTVGIVVLPAASGGLGDGTGDELAEVSEPIDAVTGRVYTRPVEDLSLPGPLPLRFVRSYSSHAAHRDVGLGWGWTHSFGWRLELDRDGVVVWTDEGIVVRFETVATGSSRRGPFGWRLMREQGRFGLLCHDGLLRSFAPEIDGAGRYRLVAVSDAFDNTIALEYAAGALTSIVDAVGRRLVLAQDDHGHIAAISVGGVDEPLLRYRYDEAGRLLEAIDAEGYAHRYAYDACNRLTLRRDRTDLAFHFVYDASGRGIETWGDYPDGDPSLDPELPATLADGVTPARGVHHVRIRYLGDGESEVIDAAQRRRFSGNRHGLVDAARDAAGTIRYRYDARGLMVGATDALGGEWRIDRNVRGDDVAVADPLGRTNRCDVGPSGAVWTDPAGHALRLERAGADTLISDPLGATARVERDRRGLPVRVHSPNGAVSEIDYDAHGNPITLRQPDGAVWRWSYDGLGRRTEAIDPTGARVRYQHSPRGDVIAVEQAGGVTRARYDGEQQLIELCDPAGRRWSFAWGGYHRLWRRVDPLGHEIVVGFDREGQPVRVRNENGEEQRYRYDAAGRIVWERSFDGRELAYGYDAAGRLTRRETPAGTVRYRYDAAGQLLERDAGAWVERFAYDALGRLTRAESSDGVCSFERDARGRVVRELHRSADSEHWVASSFDACGNRVARTSSLGHRERYERDVMGRRTATLLGERRIEHQRDRLGREIARRLPGAGLIETGYDALGNKISRRIGAAGGAPAVERSYHYDRGDELCERRDADGRALSWSYDAAGRLVRFASDGAEETFDYDAAGNRRAGGAAIEHQRDASGRTIERREIGGGETRTWRFEWLPLGQLRRVLRPDGSSVSFRYDALARRIRKTVSDARGEPLAETRFVWDGDVLVHEIDAHGATRSHAFADEPFVPLAFGEGDAWRHYALDRTGAPEELVSDGGRVAASMTRHGFGLDGEAPLRWLGQYHDAETGLSYNRARYYDPQAGTYLSPDPLGLAAGMHAYRYAPSPTRWVDPLGLDVVNVSHSGGANPYADPGPDYFVMISHGGNEGTYLPSSSPTSRMTDDKDGYIKYTDNPSEIADFIRNHPQYKKGMTVILISCRAGKGKNSIAEKLAKALAGTGSKVVAPETYTTPGGKQKSYYLVDYGPLEVRTESSTLQNYFSTFADDNDADWVTFGAGGEEGRSDDAPGGD